MRKLYIKKVGLFKSIWIKSKTKTYAYIGRQSQFLEGVELIGYYKKGDSFIIKHPEEEIYWCVSRSFIKELAKAKL